MHYQVFFFDFLVWCDEGSNMQKKEHKIKVKVHKLSSRMKTFSFSGQYCASIDNDVIEINIANVEMARWRHWLTST